MKKQNKNKSKKEKSMKASHKNLLPGNLNYTGVHKYEKFEAELMIYDFKKVIKRSFEKASDLLIEIEKYRNNEKVNVWINITGLNSRDELSVLSKQLNIDKMIVEDIVHISNHSKYNITEDMIFTVLKMMYAERDIIKNESIAILMKENIILTFQETKGDVFDHIRNRIEKNEGIIRKSNIEYLYYCLLDSIIDNYIEIINVLEYQMDEIEEKLLENKKIDVQEIYKIKKQLLLLKTTAFPQNNFVNDLKKDKRMYTDELKSFLEDLSEHTEYLTSEINSKRELITNILESHMLIVSNDMNLIMTTLTIFSAIFIPLSFLAGVFGMNFEYMPGIANNYGFYWFIGATIIMSISMITIFKMKKWF